MSGDFPDFLKADPAVTLPASVVFTDSLGVSMCSLSSIGSIDASRPSGQAKVGVYANLSNGNLCVEDYQVQLSDSGLELTLGMVYNSQRQSGWRLSIGRQVKVQSDKVITIELDDGAVLTFNLSSDGKMFLANTPVGNYELVKTSSGFTLVHPGSGEVSQFNTAGFESSRVNRDGVGIHFSYDDKNALVSLLLPSGRSVKWANKGDVKTMSLYDSNAKPLKTLATYTLNKQGLLQKTVIALNSAQDYSIKYSYNQNGLMTSMNQSDQTSLSMGYLADNGASQISTITDGESRQLSFNYADTKRTWLFGTNKDNQCTATLNADLQLASLDRPTVAADGTVSQATTTYVYTDSGCVETINYADGTSAAYTYDKTTGYVATRTSPLIKNQHYYDETAGVLLANSALASVGGTEQTVTTYYVYDKNAQLQYSITPSGCVTKHVWDDQSHLLAKTYTQTSQCYVMSGLSPQSLPALSDVDTWWSQQNITQAALVAYAYDACGLIESRTAYAEVDASGAGVETDAMQQMSYTYTLEGAWLTRKERLSSEVSKQEKRTIDGLGREVSVSEASNPPKSIAYFDAQQYVSITQPSGLIQKTSWDQSGLSISDSETDGKRTLDTTYQRDADRGRIEAVNTPRGVWQLSHNPAGQLARVSGPCADETSLLYDLQARLKDQVRHASTQSGVNLSETVLYYDSKPVFVIDADGYVEETQYDHAKRITGHITYATPLASTVQRVLDKDGKLAGLVSDPADRKTVRFLNADGHLIGEQDAAGFVKAFALNATGKVLRQRVYHVAQPAGKNWQDLSALLADVDCDETTYTPDLLGNNSTAMDPSNNLTQQTWLGNGDYSQRVECVGATADDQAKTITRSFNALNLLASSEFQPVGRQIEHAYDVHDQPTDVLTTDTQSKKTIKHVTFSRDEWGRKTTETGPRDKQQRQFIYDDKTGLHMQTLDSLGNCHVFYRDAYKRPIITIDPEGYAIRFVYDEFGNNTEQHTIAKQLTADDRTKLPGGLITKDVLSLVATYESDANDIKITYSYNGRGLKTKKADAEQYVTAITWNAFKEKIKIVRDIDHQGAVHVTTIKKEMCPDGSPGCRQVTIEDPDGLNYSTTDMLNYLGQSSKTTLPDTAAHTYEYRFDGKCLQHHDVALGASESWTYDRWGRLRSHTDFLGAQQTYKYDDKARTVTITSPEGRVTVKGLDALGNPVLTVDPAGAKTQRAFNAGADLISITDALGHEDSYQHNPEGWLLETQHANGLVITQTMNGKGLVILQVQQSDGDQYQDAFDHDEVSHVTLHTDANKDKHHQAFSPRGLMLLEQTDLANGLRMIKRAYDGAQREILVTHQDQNQTFTRQSLRDVLGREVGVVKDPKTDDSPAGLNLTTHKSLNARGRVVQLTDPEGNKSWQLYNLANQLCYTISATGLVASYQHNAMHKIYERHYTTVIDTSKLSSASTVSDVKALLTAAGDDSERYYFYDKDKLLRFSVTGMGRVTERVYDQVGRKQGEIRYATPIDVTKLTIGDLSSVRSLVSAVKLPGKDRPQIDIFDAVGKVIYTIAPNGCVTYYTRDKSGNQVSKTVFAKLLDLTNPVSWTEESISALVDFKDTDNHVSYQVFDTFNRLRYAIDEELYVVGYDYDGVHNQVDLYAFPTELTSLPDTIDVASLNKLVDKTAKDVRHTHVGFDALKRKTASTDGAGNKESWCYTALDKVSRHIDQSGNDWLTTFDGAGRVQSELTPVTSVHEVMPVEGDDEAIELSPIVTQQRLSKTYKRDGNDNVVALQRGTADQLNLREAAMVFNADSRHVSTSMTAEIDDPSKDPASPSDLPVQSVTIKKSYVYHAAGKPMVSIGEAGGLWFKVYDKDVRLVYEVSSLGAIRQFKRNAFGEAEHVIHYANVINLTLTDYAKTGLTVADIEADGVIKPDADRDRNIYIKFSATGKKEQIQLSKELLVDVQAGDILYDKAMQPTTQYVCNSFDQIIAKKVLVFSGDTPTWKETRYWLNKRGDRLAEVDSEGYVTLYQVDYDGKATECLEIAAKFDLSTLPENIQDLTKLVMSKADPTKDHHYIMEYDLLGNQISKTLKDESVESLQLDNNNLTSLGLPRPQVSTEVKDLVTRYAYDPRIKAPTHTTLPSGAVSYDEYDTLKRRSIEHGIAYDDQYGDQATATYYPYKQTLYDAFNASIGTLESYVAKDKASGLVLFGPNPIKVKLKLRDSRGLPVRTQNAIGGVSHVNYTPTRLPARQWHWVSRFVQDAKDPSTYTQPKQLKQSKLTYDAENREAVRVVIDYQGKATETHLKRNLFGEVVAEGPDGKVFPLKHIYNKLGAIFYENKKGVPRVYFWNGVKEKKVMLQSPSVDLSKHVSSPAELEQLLVDANSKGANYLQRTALEHSLQGNVTAQHRPKFTMQKPQTAEPYYTSFSIGSGYKALGATSISWPKPAETYLVATMKLWPHGDDPSTAVTLKATVDTDSSRMGVDVSKLASNYYDYELLLTYDINQGGGPDLGDMTPPTYRSTGESLPVITPVINDSTPLMMQVVDYNQVKLAGKLDGLTGVEVWQDGKKICKKVVATSPDDPKVLLIDLSDQVTGNYQFKPIYKPIIPIDDPVKIGSTTKSGMALELFSPTYKLKSTQGPDSSAFTLSYTDMPSICEFVLDWKHGKYEAGSPLSVKEVVEESEISLSAQGGDISLPTDYIWFEKPIKLAVYAKDKHGNKGLVNDIRFNAILPSSSSDERVVAYNEDAAFIYPDQPVIFLFNTDNKCDRSIDLIVIKDSQGNEKILPLSEVFPGAMIGSIQDSDYKDAFYQVGQLCDADPALDLLPEVYIQASQLPQEFSAFEVSTGNVNIKLVTQDGMTVYKLSYQESPFWNQDREAQLSFKLEFDDGASYSGVSQSGTPNTAFFGTPVGQGGGTASKLVNVSLSFKINDESVVVYLGLPKEISRQDWTMGGHIINYQIQGSILYFSPLPANVDSFTLRYLDHLAVGTVWRDLDQADLTDSKKAIVANAMALNPGQYDYQLVLKDKDKNVLQTITDKFTVSHGDPVIPSQGQSDCLTVGEPVIQQSFDRWQNMQAQTDELGNTTQFLFNKRDKRIKRTLPAIEVTDEHGEVSTMSPVDDWGYGLDGHVVAHTDANKYVMAHWRNLAGMIQKTIRADGVAKCFIVDGFNRPYVIESASGLQWTKAFNLEDQIIAVTDPHGNKQQTTFNELKEKVMFTTPSGQVWRTNYDALGYVATTWNPLNQPIDYKHDRNGMLMQMNDHTTVIDGKSAHPLVYVLDYFGNLDASQPYQIIDRSGAQYVVTMNFNMELVSKKSTGGDHGQYYDFDGKLVDVPPVDIQYVRDEAGNTIYILDDAMGLSSFFHYDLKRRCIGERFRNSEGMVCQDTLVSLNPVGWLTEVLDNILQAKYDYDAVGNRRSTKAYVKTDAGLTELNDENWFLYNEANVMTLDRGTLTDQGDIVITAGKGTKLAYNADSQRTQEQTIDKASKPHQKAIHYVKGTFAGTDYDGNPDISVTVNNDGARTHYASARGGKETNTGYDGAGRLNYIQTIKAGKNQSETKFSSIDVNGLAAHQDVFAPQEDGWNLHDALQISYKGFMTPCRSKVSGQRDVQHEQSATVAYIDIYNGANGNVSSLQGYLPNNDGFRKFATNAENRIVMKQDGHTAESSQSFERFFYNPTTKKLIGKVGNIKGPDPGQSSPNTDLSIDFDLGYHAVDAQYPPAAPSVYTPSEPETFNQISEMMFGDASFGDEIALANNASSGEDQIGAGRMVHIPALSNTDLHNWQGDYAVYDVGAIIGSEYPNMPMPQLKPPKHHFWSEFLEAIVGVVGIVLDIELGGLLSGVLGDAVAKVVGDMASGLVTNIIDQEIGLASGLQHHFSWDSLASTEVSAGVAGGFSPLETGKLLERLSMEELSTLSTQVVERALGVQKHLDWTQFMTTAVDAGLVPQGKLDIQKSTFSMNDFTSQLARGELDTLVDTGIEGAVHHSFDPENEAAMLLGTAVGDAAVYSGYAYKTREARHADQHLAAEEASWLKGLSLPGDSLSLTRVPDQSASPHAIAHQAKQLATSAQREQQARAYEHAAMSLIRAYGSDIEMGAKISLSMMGVMAGLYSADHAPSRHGPGLFGQVGAVTRQTVGELQADYQDSTLLGDVVGLGKGLYNRALAGADFVAGGSGGLVERKFGLNIGSGQRLGSDLVGLGILAAPFLRGVVSEGAGAEGAAQSELRLRVEANIAVSRAARETSSFAPFSRKATALNFYLKYGFDSDRALMHLRGIDFSDPVLPTVVNKGEAAIQYYLPRTKAEETAFLQGSPKINPGNYFAPTGTPASKLGIYTSGRQQLLFFAKTDTLVLQSTTLPMVDDYSMSAYEWQIETEGGATQYFSPFKDDWEPSL